MQKPTYQRPDRETQLIKGALSSFEQSTVPDETDQPEHAFTVRRSFIAGQYIAKCTCGHLILDAPHIAEPLAEAMTRHLERGAR